MVADIGSPSSLLYFDVLSSSSVFYSPVNSVLASLGGFAEVMLVLAVLLVAAKRKTGGGTLRTLLWFLCIFFFFLLPSASASLCFLFFYVCSSFTPLSLSLSLSLLAFLSFSYSPLFPSLSFFSLFHYPSSLLLYSTLPLLMASVLLF